MPPAFDRPVLVLLCAQGGEPFESGADASDRRVVHEVPVLRQPPDGPPVAAGRRLRRPSPGSQVDAIDRPGGDLSGAENQRAASHAPDLSLSSQRDGYRPAQSGLVRRHHLYPRPAWLSVPGSDHGLGDALARYGQPEIFNTDQGSQFTSLDFTGVLKNASIRISMDGRGRCMDNIFIERLWRSLKYEAVYLHELTDGFAAERVIGEWIGFYNTERPHSSLGGQTPAEAYGAGQPVDMMDKPDGLPTSPQAQQQQQDVIKRILAA